MHRAEWCYISGATAAAETRLLRDEEMLDLLRAGSPALLVSRLRQNRVYRDVSTETDAEGLSARIESAVVDALRELGSLSPATGPADLLLSPYDHQQVRNFIKAQVHGHRFEASPFSQLTENELAAAWEDRFEAQGRWAGVCRSVRRELAEGGDPDIVIDLVVDHDELAGLRDLGAKTESEFIEACFTEYSAAKGKLAVVRARLAGLEADQVRRLGKGLVSDNALNELVETPVERLGHVLGLERSREGEASEGLSRLALEIDNRMTDRLREARGFAFGPEIVFGYGWGLWVECLNLKLISETRLLGAPADMTEWRLRKSYV